MSDTQKPTKRKQLIDFDDCDRCGVGQLYQINDADDGFFYDGDAVICDNCGFEVGKTLCGEDDCRVTFHDEIDVSHYDSAMTKYDKALARISRLRGALEVWVEGHSDCCPCDSCKALAQDESESK